MDSPFLSRGLHDPPMHASDSAQSETLSSRSAAMFELSTSKDEFVSAYTKVGADTTDDFDRNGLRLGRWSVGLFGCLSDCIPNGLSPQRFCYLLSTLLPLTACVLQVS